MTKIYTQDCLQTAKNKVAEIELALATQNVPASRLRIKTWPKARLCQIGADVFQWINMESCNRLNDIQITDVGNCDKINVAKIKAAYPQHLIFVTGE